MSDAIKAALNPNGGIDVNAGAVDTTTGALEFIDYAHHEVHAGKHYNYLDTHTLAKNGVIDHMIVTPDTDTYAHFVIGGDTITSTVLLAMYEGTTYSDPGIVEPMINRNRNFPDDNTTELYETPTITDLGTRLLQITMGAGKNSEGGSSRDDNEIVLKRNTAYLIRATEQNIASTVVNLKFDWYEQTIGA